MLTKLLCTRSVQNCKQNINLFTLIAILSAGLGVVFTASVGNVYLLLMRKAASCLVSIVGSTVTVILPFLVSFYLVVHSKLTLAYFICAIHIFILSSAWYAILCSFGSAGWLIHGMLQFPNLCLTVVLVWLLFTRITNQYSRRFLFGCVIIAFIIGMIDYCLISPFLANLLETYETMGRYAIHVGLDRCI